MRYLPINNKLFTENRKRFVKLLPKDSVAIFYSNDKMPRNGDQYFPFRQQSDFFYFTGIDQEESILIIAPDIKNKKLKEALFIVKTNDEIAIWEGHSYTKEKAKKISGIENIYWINDFDLILKEVISATNNIYLYRNEYPKFSPEVQDRNQRLGEKLKNEFPLHNYNRSAPLLTKLRLIKSDEEIALLQKAIDITNKAFRRVLNTTKPGKFEFEIQAEIDHEFTINRANGHGYAPIIASGGNACVLHYIENDKECKDGDLLLFDFGAEYANYSADMSRTIPVNGKFTSRQKDCYDAVLNVLKQAIKLYIPGNTINIINKKVNVMLEKEMIKLGLFTAEDVRNQDQDAPLFKKYFMHGTAHFLGLDVHDVGDKEEMFKPGMVLTCEPGIYLPDENIGIRIENNILITKSDPIDLMENIPIEIEEIESIMANK
ncbi:MAG: aminopeptidase P N-terminal domain-containing protein [Bacteroidetes bacterium]|nr:aminopeptidase P N-terminal domain-containing protein [Bacteroidota bacterium]